MRKLLTVAAAIAFLLSACQDRVNLKDNITSYNSNPYKLNYAFLKKDRQSDGSVYYHTLYLTSDATPSPLQSAYSILSADHTLELNIISDSPEITEGSYEFATGSIDPFHFSYLQYYFKDLNQNGFATSGTLDVTVDDSEYDFELTIRASNFVNSVNSGEVVTIKSHYKGTLTTG